MRFVCVFIWVSDSSHPGESGGGGKMIVLVVYREQSCVLAAYALAARRKALMAEPSTSW